MTAIIANVGRVLMQEKLRATNVNETLIDHFGPRLFLQLQRGEMKQNVVAQLLHWLECRADEATRAIAQRRHS